MRKTYVLLCAASLLLAGCFVQSLHPFYTEQDVVFAPGLIGTWITGEKESDEAWTFEKTESNKYKLIITDRGEPYSLDAHLAKLGTNLFLDLGLPEEGLKGIDDLRLYGAFLTPTHSIVKVWQLEPELGLSFMSPKWLGDLLEKEPNALRHEKIDNRIILTASTKELQGFILKHANNTNAFEIEKENLLRRKPEPSEKKKSPPVSSSETK
jgi:hypothetical protein